MEVIFLTCLLISSLVARASTSLTRVAEGEDDEIDEVVDNCANEIIRGYRVDERAPSKLVMIVVLCLMDQSEVKECKKDFQRNFRSSFTSNHQL